MQDHWAAVNVVNGHDVPTAAFQALVLENVGELKASARHTKALLWEGIPVYVNSEACALERFALGPKCEPVEESGRLLCLGVQMTRSWNLCKSQLFNACLIAAFLDYPSNAYMTGEQYWHFKYLQRPFHLSYQVLHLKKVLFWFPFFCNWF